ncbi:MAG TPA: DUF2090 domain-containing protein [Dehalococcoidia bacterium]|nr:DUF2090 domain-containing protein [Dehalococcoidia bacterium]
MKGKLGMGKLRGLQQLASEDGIFAICAMDHRSSLHRMIQEAGVANVSYEDMVQRKLELCSTLAPHASAVLLDPEYGIAPCIARHVLPGGTGLLVSIEATGYGGSRESRLTTLLEGWSVEKIKRLGASGVKMLVYYHPDLAEVAQRQRDTVSEVAQDCLKYDIPFVVEPLSYPIEAEAKTAPQFATRKPQIVIDTARQITGLPIDILKAEFPADFRYISDEGQLLDLCHKLDQASRVPWVLLSAGVSYEAFCTEVKIACQAGASGFLAGRALWQEALSIADARDRLKFLSTTVVDRLNRLKDIATKYATPWQRRLNLETPPAIPENWYGLY